MCGVVEPVGIEFAGRCGHDALGIDQQRDCPKRDHYERANWNRNRGEHKVPQPSKGFDKVGDNVQRAAQSLN